MRNVNITPCKDILENYLNHRFLKQHDNTLGVIQSPDLNNFGRNSNANCEPDPIMYASAPKKSLQVSSSSGKPSPEENKLLGRKGQD